MKILDVNGALAIVCERCNVSIKSYKGEVQVGVHGGDIRVFHDYCAADSFQFVHNEADRTISLQAFMTELQQAAAS